MINNKIVKIIPPEGYEIDKEKSTFEQIVFKPIVERWRDNETAFIKGYYINLTSIITDVGTSIPQWNTPGNHNVFATKAQAKAALAMARISQIMANDERFGSVVSDKEWNTYDDKYIIGYDFKSKNYYLSKVWNSKTFLAFHTEKQGQLFIKENEDLLNDYFMTNE